MVDICMCKGDGCDKKLLCYRYMAAPDKYRQTYFAESPMLKDKCRYFTELTKITEFGKKENKNGK